ncbi:MAG: FeoA family protein [Sphingorhabdus sp.]
MRLDSLPLKQSARIISVDWAAIPAGEAHRLRSLGLEEDVEISILHRGILFWRDPIALRIGRMTVALRGKVANAIKVEQVGG